MDDRALRIPNGSAVSPISLYPYPIASMQVLPLLCCGGLGSMMITSPRHQRRCIHLSPVAAEGSDLGRLILIAAATTTTPEAFLGPIDAKEEER